jgi:isopenicillin-N epimerase
VPPAPPTPPSPPPAADDLRQAFLLRPGVIFLNHGSFGACPRPVFAAYQEWQRELEAQPVEFLGRRGRGLLAEARRALGAYVGAAADDLVYVPNSTFALNVVARALPLTPGDEVLATDHEYGAMERAWTFVCERRGARYVRQPVPVPCATEDEVVQAVWAGVTPRTRVLFLSHITSPTALIFPVAALVRRAREAGILTVIDGAHAPGQVPLDLGALGADFYVANCHKWLCAPKGSCCLPWSSPGAGAATAASAPAPGASWTSSSGRGRVTCPPSWRSRPRWSSSGATTGRRCSGPATPGWPGPGGRWRR